MPYLNVEEFEPALQALAASHPRVTELILLPNPTSEGRLSHALRVSPPNTQGADTMVLTGGVHAREWVPPDALVNLAADLLEAHSRGTGLRYGQQRFSADAIRSVVEGLQVVLSPCVNPDGRHHSQAAEPMWRKNRRRVVPVSDPDCVGVDINRNFVALWDFRRYFAPDSNVNSSDDPCNPDVYVGPATASEAETCNVVWLLDRYRAPAGLSMCTATSRQFFTTGGFDTDQTSDPMMNFRNPGFDGLRGRVGDAYREFIPVDDLRALQDLGNRMNPAIEAASGTSYGLEQSFALYPTSGASDDYAYSRHFVQPSNSKILSFTIECGRSFYPHWPEAEQAICEVCSGLTAVCVTLATPAV